MVKFAKPHVSVIYTDLWRNMIMLISYDFYTKNLTVRFTMYTKTINTIKVFNYDYGLMP